MEPSMDKPSFALLIAKRMKDTDKASGGADMAQDDSGEGDSKDAVAENATKAFFEAGQSGDYDKAYDVLKDLVEMCGMEDEGSEDEQEPSQPEEPDMSESSS